VHALRDDLASGAWYERHRDLLELAELHLGYYVVIAEVGARGRPMRRIEHPTLIADEVRARIRSFHPR